MVHLTMQPVAVGITINMEYTDEGDPQPHDENPTWDPAGVILKAHFQAAKQIWESLLPGPGDYEFDFHWDDDIPGLGLTTDLGALDVFIEINPTYSWFADPTPLDAKEFSPGLQTLYSGLSSGDKATYFPGTAPPGALEVGFRASGIADTMALNTKSASGQMISTPGGPVPVDASNGPDLLSTIVHEMGHVLGIGADILGEPGEFNILPLHVGGLEDVLVLEGDGGHLAGMGTVPFLMCENCGAVGVRRFPTATDILVVAEDQGITDVRLARVGSITGGLWHTAGNWIGADVPDLAQDAYIQHGGTVTLGADAAIKDLTVGSGSSLVIGNRILSSTGTFNFAGSTSVSVAAGGILYADQILRGANDLATAAGSRVEFNSYSGGAATSATFNGSVGIGTSTNTPAEVTFDPTTIGNWSIASELSIGAGGQSAHFVINNMMDVTSGAGQLGSGTISGAAGRVTVDGAGSSWVVNGGLRVGTGSINVTNSGQIQSASADVGTSSGLANVDINSGLWHVSGNIEIGPTAASSEGGGQVNLGNSGTLRANGNLVLRGTPTRTGVVTLYSGGLLDVDGTVTVSPFGRIVFRDSSYAHSGILGSETIENSGGTADFNTGGVTQFLDSSTAGNAHIVNRPGTTTFATGGETQFRGTSKAGSLLTSGKTRIDNYPNLVGYYSGTTRFFDSASGGDSDFYNHPGGLISYATIEFNDDSSGGFGTYTNLAGVSGQSLGGTIAFNDRAKAGNGVYTNAGEGGYIVFNENSSADQGTFSTADNIGGNSRIHFFGNSTAANANFSMGYNTSLQFYEYSTAADANITVRQGGYVFFSGSFTPDYSATTTAADAEIVLEGGSVFGARGGSAGFSTWSTAGDSTIIAHGGTVNGGAGATIEFDYTAHAGAATLIAHGGTGGGTGAQINFRRGATGDNSRIVVNQGGVANFGGNIAYGGTSVGSIEGAGIFALNGSELRTGGLNSDTVVSGQIVDVLGTNPNGSLTKVGTGTMSLDGANTYSGPTTVQAGSLLINGSIVGNVTVNSGATLGGTGTIGGSLAVADGGILSPGSSPGTLTVGSLALSANSIINFELGVVSDLLIVNGNLTLDGVINISAGAGLTPAGQDIFLYTGALTDNGLTVGSVPQGFSLSDFTFDYSIPGKIRLLADLPEIPGDYNQNGVVDAADYAVWRNHMVSGLPLPNDDSPGVNQDDYVRWKQNFGAPLGSGAILGGDGESLMVPEPSLCILAVSGVVGLLALRKKMWGCPAAFATEHPQR